MPNGCSLYADTAIDVGQLVAGVGVQIVGRAPVELVTLADLAANDQPERHRSERRRDPADGLQQVWVFRKGALAGSIDGLLHRSTAGVHHLFRSADLTGTFAGPCAAAEFG